MTRYNFYASIGPSVKSGEDPIYKVANHFPPSRIILFTSDELSNKSIRGTVDENFEMIREYFKKAGVHTTIERMIMDDFDENVVKIASRVIKERKKNQDPIVFDLTAGRGAISHAMARAAQLIVDYYKEFKASDLLITCAIKPFNSDLITFRIGPTRLPNKKDMQMLGIVEKNVSQTALAQDLKWNNQSEVSKSIKRLTEKGLVVQKGYSVRKLTDTGKHFRRFLRNLSETRE